MNYFGFLIHCFGLAVGFALVSTSEWMWSEYPIQPGFWTVLGFVWMGISVLGIAGQMSEAKA